jgi:F-type H+-transporting ATPase subunit alpha
VISITDGQIFLETDLFNAGVKPAINVGLSVSRVGGDAQIKAMKQVAGTMKLDLAQFRELQAFSQFSSDLDAKTKARIDRGDRLTEVLKQAWDKPINVIDQILIIWAATRGHLDMIKKELVTTYEPAFLEYMHTQGKEVIESIKKESKIIDPTEAMLVTLVTQFNDMHAEWKVEAI